MCLKETGRASSHTHHCRSSKCLLDCCLSLNISDVQANAKYANIHNLRIRIHTRSFFHAYYTIHIVQHLVCVFFFLNTTWISVQNASLFKLCSQFPIRFFIKECRVPPMNHIREGRNGCEAPPDSGQDSLPFKTSHPVPQGRTQQGRSRTNEKVDSFITSGTQLPRLTGLPKNIKSSLQLV